MNHEVVKKEVNLMKTRPGAIEMNILLKDFPLKWKELMEQMLLLKCRLLLQKEKEQDQAKKNEKYCL